MNGIQNLPTTVSTATYTVLTSDLVLMCDPTSNAIAITMYNNPPDGATILIYDETKQAATHNITINPGTAPASAKVDNTSSLVLNINGQAVTLTYHLSTNNWAAEVTRSTSGSGTVTSVAMTGDGVIFNSTVSGSAITTSGTLAPALLTQTKNTVLSGPTTGSNAAPTFRTLVGADLPNPASSTLGGIQSYAAVSNQWINAISTSGVPSSTQPAFSNLSGTLGSSQIQSGVFASIPSASSATGLFYYATDVGAGTLLVSNGSIWRAAGGVCSFYNSGVKTGSTSSTSEVNLLTVAFPANLVSANGSLEFVGNVGATGTNGTKTIKAYISATGGTTVDGTNILSFAMTAAQLNQGIYRYISNRNSQSSQITSAAGNNGFNASSAAAAAPAINMANAWYLKFTGQLGSASDTMYIDNLGVKWIE